MRSIPVLLPLSILKMSGELKPAPKRPLTAFMRFSSVMRPKVKVELPELAFGAVAKEVGKRWRELGETEKAGFQATSAAAKVVYDAAKAVWDALPADKKVAPKPRKTKGSKAAGGKAKKKKKDPNAPKRSRSAYIFYGASVRPEIKAAHPDMAVTVIMKEIGLMWAKVTDEGKTKFNQMAAADKVRYETEMRSYVPPTVAE